MSTGETRITQAGPLHGADGRLTQPGWATSMLLDYRRSAVKAPKWRLKEWDYYLINDEEYAVALTLSDLGYVGLISVSLMDFAQATYTTSTVVTPLPMGRFRLPSSSVSGISEFENGRVSLRFEAKNGVRTIRARFARFDGDDDLSFEAILDDEPRDSMVIATPWAEDPLAFYYNQKIVGMRACGSFRKGLMVHGFSRSDSFGLLDWGRGVWTRDNTWYWAVAQGWQDGQGGYSDEMPVEDAGFHVVGLNLGYGFGDTSAASENMAFIDGVAHKLGRVDFGIPTKTHEGGEPPKKIADQYELLQPWHVTDDEGRLDLTFTPVLDRVDWMDYKLILSDQHQVFGTFDGVIVLDDGTPFQIADLQGSAEVIHNVY